MFTVWEGLTMDDVDVKVAANFPWIFVRPNLAPCFW
jgi:hypothetical protein